jgi:hypothetical protein
MDSMQSEDMPVLHQPDYGRFEIQLDSELAVLNYILDGKTMIFTHTGVPPAWEGRGIGSRLARTGLEYARQHGYWVVPQCSFIEAYIRRHREFQALLAD